MGAQVEVILNWGIAVNRPVCLGFLSVVRLLPCSSIIMYEYARLDGSAIAALDNGAILNFDNFQVCTVLVNVLCYTYSM